MEGKVCLLFLIVLIMASVLDGQTLGGPMHGKAVVCYVGTWATYRSSAGKFDLADIEPSLCTHLIYSFAGLDAESNRIKSLDPWQDLEDNYGKGGFKKMVTLKQRYPHLKVTIAIGGWNEGSDKYSKMANTEESRSAFVKSVLQFLDKFKFDGLDLDWEYPTKRGGRPEDKANYVAMVKMLKDAFEPHGYILTAALGAGKTTMESAYDMAKLSRYLDLIHMMCYDYHGTWDGVFGANAPLRGIDNQDVLSLEYTIKYLLDQGVSSYKIVLGLPTYGRTSIMENPETEEIEFGKTPVKSAGFPGPFTKENGFMGYNEICLETSNKSSKWTSYWNKQTATPYLRDNDRLISYDSTRSIAIKVKMAVRRNLGGVMVWSMDTDDFKGSCSPENDTYIDFVDSYNSIVNEPVLREALKTLKLPDAHRIENLSRRTAYAVSDGKLVLRLPEQEYSNYPLLRTINEVITLALEEKRILDEMDVVTRENVIEKEDSKGAGHVLTSSISILACSLFFFNF